MPSGVPVPLSVKRVFFDLVCGGMTTTEASVQVGVSRRTGWSWWRHARGMKLRKGGDGLGGLAQVGDLTRTGGRGHRLSFTERYEIDRALQAGLSYAAIGDQLGRDRSVIWREVQRNRLPDGTYHALMAHARATENARRPKAFKLDDPGLCADIEAWMDQGWSPKLISQVLARDAGSAKVKRVSHETIYQSLYVQTRGQLRADLHKCLSTSRTQRKPRGQTERRGRFGDVMRISARPAEAADRAVPGHWEGDLIIGARGGSAIGTLVERSTRFTILLHLPGDHTAETVAAAMLKAMGDLPDHLRRSITWDRGSEMAGWQDISLQLQSPVYFCDPHSPWQRGTNENTNRLLRFWFEKGTDLSGYTPDDLKAVADKLNTRPRPTLDLDTPAQRMAQLLSQAA
ncbi:MULTISPECIES: IS30 family transposase [Mycolicibacterium]|jgi:IS30 family transposase|uniref:Integrase, catalytic region n=4 Tax=Mycolicibacterium TaxID=1866885 RepID=A1T5B2_MYCVP|nr:MULTISPECIES: IS30 family transposase [Mycolicibacterium]ABM12362.1 Integrase, catalytic region [Mycolicibacterium vanbaalenii PYR-1]ABM15429.1 Integrase, catalytic region [Mycolicibacterium vanbaalenii PYR-1]MCV7129125.1 IS30 family transposase [Mycolicibacterium vanbaalenii PYR-1]MDN4517598.1 IS30 family transposase [Mycolicibacterium austroafricanum]MDN4517651.1 IS30 family transposase [Mycolicibacterium austroafricanum]